MNRLTIEGVLVGDLEGEIRTHLERSGYERNVIDEIDPAVRNAVELVTNGLWQNFFIQEREHGTTAGATASQVTRPQQRSLDQHLVGNEVTAEGKRDAKSDASSLTDSPKVKAGMGKSGDDDDSANKKPKAATETSVGDDSDAKNKNVPADNNTTLSATGTANDTLNSEEAGGDTAEEGDGEEEQEVAGIRRTVRQTDLHQNQRDASAGTISSVGSMSYTQAPNIDTASGNTEQTGSTGTK
jgi:hypothetical protein